MSGNKEIFARNLVYYMDKKGVDRNQLCADLDLKYTTVRDWTKGITYPRIGKVELLANYFGIQKSDLIEDKNPSIKTYQKVDIESSTLQRITETSSKLVPERQLVVLDIAEKQLEEQSQVVEEELYEYQVYEKLSAGTGSSYFNDGNFDTVYYDEELDHDFASWIYGDSMEPRFLNGEVALIKDTGFDYDGAIYAVEWDGQTYIKKVEREENGLRLISLNSKYKDKIAPYDEDPRIIGKIVGSFQPVSI